jgi:hypothetical protein
MDSKELIKEGFAALDKAFGTGSQVPAQFKGGYGVASPLAPSTGIPDPNRTYKQDASALTGFGIGDPLDEFTNDLYSGRIAAAMQGHNLPEATGVNDADHQSTLLSSRLADALNNRVYRSLTPIRDMQATKGGGKTGNQEGANTLFKMQPISTAETRAQGRAEGYEQAERGAEISRQQAYQNRDLQLRELMQLEQLRRSGQMNDVQNERYNELYNELLRQGFVYPFNQRYARSNENWTSNLGKIVMPEQQSKLITDLERGENGQEYNPVMARIIGTLVNGMYSQPSPEQLAIYDPNGPMAQLFTQFGNRSINSDQLLNGLMQIAEEQAGALGSNVKQAPANAANGYNKGAMPQNVTSN